MLLENAVRARFKNPTSGNNGDAFTDYAEAEPFLDALDAADVFVVSGQGGLNDEFVEHSTGTLLALDRAIRLGKSTVMLSQGIGPITNLKLSGLARLVLPRVDLTFLREGLSGPGVLKSLGCRADRILVTGDDAIEMALQSSQNSSLSLAFARLPRNSGDSLLSAGSVNWYSKEAALGDAIGINARVTYYSAVANDDLQPLREVIHELGVEFHAPLLGLPIWRPRNEGDLLAIHRLLSGYERQADAGQTLDSPEKLIQQIGNCRIVITGSYHAAVFALALGIPVVALCNSPYYDWKFKGLATQFGAGLVLVPARDSAFKTKLADAARELWEGAPELKPGLIGAARKQLVAAREAFSKVQALVASTK